MRLSSVTLNYFLEILFLKSVIFAQREEEGTRCLAAVHRNSRARHRLPLSSTADVMNNDVMHSNCFFATFPLNNVRANRQLANTVTEARDMAIQKTREIDSSQATALQPPVISLGPISLR